MFRWLAILSLFFVFGTDLTAQATATFSGLKRTKLSYLANRIEALSTGDRNENLSIDIDRATNLATSLETTRQLLVNLPAITKAEFEVIITSNDTLVQWTVQESRTVFPLFNFGRIKDNFTYLLGFNDIHFRGLGQTLSGYYQNNDGEHNYSIALTNQAYRGSRWGYRVESRRYAAIEPLYFPTATVDYRYSNLSLGIGASFTPKPRRTFTLGVDLFREDYERLSGENAPMVGPAELIQQKYALKAGHRLDRVNYYNELLEGYGWQTYAQLVRSITDQTDFSIIFNDLLYYQRVGLRGNLAMRLRAGVSSNENSPFAPFVVDSQVNIRGSGNRIDRGTAQLVLNVEYRHSVIRDRKERYAAQLVVFSDLGNWRNPGGKLTELAESDNLRHFVGGGIRLISNQAQNAVIRLDYGIDVRNQDERGFVLGFGQYF